MTPRLLLVSTFILSLATLLQGEQPTKKRAPVVLTEAALHKSPNGLQVPDCGMLHGAIDFQMTMILI